MSESLNDSMHELAMQIRYDLTNAQGKLTELMRQIGLLEPVKDPSKCPIPGCGFRCAWNMPTLSEHQHLAHGGPVPEHWKDAA